MRIGSLDTDQTRPGVAEIGNNHEGHFDVARGAGRCRGGRGCRRGQVPDREAWIGSSAPPTRIAGRDSRRIEFAPEQWSQLAAQARPAACCSCRRRLIWRASTLLTPLVDGIKIASGDVTFAPLLDAAAGDAKADRAVERRVERSTRSSALAIAFAITGARLAHDGELAVLHCVSAYPTPAEQAGCARCHASAIVSTRPLAIPITSLGIDAAVAAVALGARVIEKALHARQASIGFPRSPAVGGPAEMTALVRRVRPIEPMLGVGGQADSGRRARESQRDSPVIAAAARLSGGHVLEPADVIWIRPGTGLAPGEESRLLIGRTLFKSVRSGALLSEPTSGRALHVRHRRLRRHPAARRYVRSCACLRRCEQRGPDDPA